MYADNISKIEKDKEVFVAKNLNYKDKSLN